jgi:hypothetical protein
VAGQYALIVLVDMAGGGTYSVQQNCHGVSGTITVTRFDQDRCEGTFSGTLGRWEPGHDPHEDPPDETIEVTDGIFKYTGVFPWRTSSAELDTRRWGRMLL